MKLTKDPIFGYSLQSTDKVDTVYGDINELIDLKEQIEEVLERESQESMGMYHEKIEQGFWNGDDDLNDIGNVKIKNKHNSTKKNIKILKDLMPFNNIDKVNFNN